MPRPPPVTSARLPSRRNDGVLARSIAVMPTGTLLTFRDNERPHAEIALHNGDHVFLALDRAGLTMTQINAPGHPVLFQAGPSVVSHICACLVGWPSGPDVTPLRVVVAIVLQLRSADELRRAFNEAAALIA